MYGFPEYPSTQPRSKPEFEGNGGQQGAGGGHDPDDPRVLQMLNLAKFDEKIHFFLGVQAEVASLRHSQDVGFVRVNAQPMKQAIR